MLGIALVATLLAAHPAPPAWPFPAAAPAGSLLQPRELPGEPGRPASSLHGVDPAWALHGARSGYQFVPAHAIDLAVAGKWLVVAANTGVWVHEADTLARRGQLSRQQVLRVAASPDGALLALALPAAKGVDVEVVALPSLELRAHATVSGAEHLRFSEDGARLVIAGGGAEEVAVLTVQGGILQRASAGEKVNDAAPMPGHPELVAAAHNGDSVDLLPLARGPPMLKTEPLIRDYWARVELHTHSFLEVFTPRPSRDQRACVFEPTGGALYGGGDDNVVWRVADPLGKAKLTRFGELDGNVVALDAVPGRVYAATDEPVLAAIDARGVLGIFHAEYHPDSAEGDYRDAQVVATREAAFAVLDGFVVRWVPGRKALVAREYGSEQGVALRPDANDVAVVVRDAGGRATLQRVAAGPAADDVEAELLGALPSDPVELALAGGVRLFVGGLAGRTRAVALPPGGKLGKPIELPFSADAMEVRPDGEELALMSRKGDLATISREGRVTRRGKLVGKGHRLAWDAAKAAWTRAGDD